MAGANPIRRSLSALAAGLFCLGLPLAAQAAAQGGGLSGRVVDGAGRAIEGLPVALHRVTSSGGATVDQTLSDAEGRFTFDVELRGDSALFFAATRSGEFLYVGPAIRGGIVPDDYVLEVGPGGNAITMGGSAAGPATPPAPASGGAGASAPSFDPGTAGTAVLLIAAVASVLATFLAYRWNLRRQTVHRRTALIELARLEASHATGSDTATPEAESAYREERARLRDRLAALV